MPCTLGFSPLRVGVLHVECSCHAETLRAKRWQTQAEDYEKLRFKEDSPLVPRRVAHAVAAILRPSFASTSVAKFFFDGQRHNSHSEIIRIKLSRLCVLRYCTWGRWSC